MPSRFAEGQPGARVPRVPGRGQSKDTGAADNRQTMGVLSERSVPLLEAEQESVANGTAAMTIESSPFTDDDDQCEFLPSRKSHRGKFLGFSPRDLKKPPAPEKCVHCWPTRTAKQALCRRPWMTWMSAETKIYLILALIVTVWIIVRSAPPPQPPLTVACERSWEASSITATSLATAAQSGGSTRFG